jgi:hypothetical protein
MTYMAQTVRPRKKNEMGGSFDVTCGRSKVSVSEVHMISLEILSQAFICPEIFGQCRVPEKPWYQTPGIQPIIIIQVEQFWLMWRPAM